MKGCGLLGMIKTGVVKKKWKVPARKKGLLSRFEVIRVEAETETAARVSIPDGYKIVRVREDVTR